MLGKVPHIPDGEGDKPILLTVAILWFVFFVASIGLMFWMPIDYLFILIVFTLISGPCFVSFTTRWRSLV